VKTKASHIGHEPTSIRLGGLASPEYTEREHTVLVDAFVPLVAVHPTVESGDVVSGFGVKEDIVLTVRRCSAVNIES